MIQDSFQAFNRVVNMVTGSDWRLAELGAPETPQEPQFDNWDDLVTKKQRQDFEREFGKLPGAGPSTNDDRDVQRVVGPKGQDPDDYYALLEVPTTATKVRAQHGAHGTALCSLVTSTWKCSLQEGGGVRQALCRYLTEKWYVCVCWLRNPCIHAEWIRAFSAFVCF